VYKAIYAWSIAFALLVAYACGSLGVQAQVAPTNSATISGSVSDIAGKPVAHANVSLSGPRNASTQTDTHGLFVFVGMPFGTYQLSAAAQDLGTATRSVTVEGDTDVAIQYEPASLHGLKVIANVSSTANAQFNVTPASVTQVNPIQNAFAGQTSWRTILEQIPGVSEAGRGNGEVNFADTTDGPFVPVQIAINGALPYETQTLLDDMPLIGEGYTSSPGQGTNLALYPLNGFGSADVVRGPGANAPSIVDSIGGSFVLHPLGVVSANHYEFSASTDPYGGIVTNALAAVHFHKLSAVVTYGVNDSPGPFSSANISFTPYMPSSIDGRAFECTGSCAVQPIIDNNYAGGAFVGRSLGLMQCCFNQTAGWTQHSGSMAVNYALSPSISAGIFYAGETSQMLNLYTSYQYVNFAPAAGYAGPLAPGVYCLGSAGGFGTVPVLQSASLFEEKITAQLGRGTLRLAALQNRTWSSQSNNYPGSATVQLYGEGSLCSNATANCSGGVYQQTFFTGGSYNVNYGGATTGPVATSYGTNTSNNRDLLLSYATPLGENLHAGVSFVKSMYNEGAWESYAGPGYGGFLCIAAIPESQTTNELRLFVGGNPSAKTSLDLSGYFVNASYHVPDPNQYIPFNSGPYTGPYQDESYTYAAPRLGFVWRPTAAMAIRASVGGGFAEAPLTDLVGSNSAPIVNNPSSPTFYETTLTNLALRPETSFAFDVGTDIRLHRNTVLSFDVYRSNLYGQLYNATSATGTFTGPEGTLPLFTNQFDNLGVSRYEGVLLDLRHDAPHGMYWKLSGGLTRGYIVSLPAGFYNAAGATCVRATNTNCANVSVVTNINFDGCFDAAIPYAQGLGTLGYRWNSEKYVDVVGTYYGNNNSYYRPAFVEFDGHVGYPVTKSMSLLLTFRNITGRYDGPVNTDSPANVTGAPTISGPPFPLYPDTYGPRTVILTAQMHL